MVASHSGGMPQWKIILIVIALSIDVNGLPFTKFTDENIFEKELQMQRRKMFDRNIQNPFLQKQRELPQFVWFQDSPHPTVEDGPEISAKSSTVMKWLSPQTLEHLDKSVWFSDDPPNKLFSPGRKTSPRVEEEKFPMASGRKDRTSLTRHPMKNEGLGWLTLVFEMPLLMR